MDLMPDRADDRPLSPRRASEPQAPAPPAEPAFRDAAPVVEPAGGVAELEAAEKVLMSLALAVESRDASTAGHCHRLATLGSRLGRQLGLDELEVHALRRAGMLHDIGKVSIPDTILLKSGPLTVAERQVMERHPVIGERICQPLPSLKPVLPIIRHHHERIDGSGYPDRLRGHQIPRAARILQVVDIYDALTSSRPYRAAMTPSTALAIMEAEMMRHLLDPVGFAGLCRMLADGRLDNPDPMEP